MADRYSYPLQASVAARLLYSCANGTVRGTTMYIYMKANEFHPLPFLLFSSPLSTSNFYSRAPYNPSPIPPRQSPAPSAPVNPLNHLPPFPCPNRPTPHPPKSSQQPPPLIFQTRKPSPPSIYQPPTHHTQTHHHYMPGPQDCSFCAFR